MIRCDSTQEYLQSKCCLNASAERKVHSQLSLVISKFAVLEYVNGEELSCHSYSMRADLFLCEFRSWEVSHACS